ncbi:response regulator transcription factor [Streptomyces sp. NBC_01142]|uniref:response regulator transcription factor n=1 Tax=Streptomyces sp. NBC_01142 TaxID=2975865 RepID=UPI002B1E2B31|nr:response regulator transcription factor [Streptomyces sp. NBC_01142]
MALCSGEQTYQNDEHVYDALRAGASGFIRKRAPAQQIAHAIRLVAGGDSVLFPDVVRRLAAARPVRRDAATGRAALLTGREIEVLRLMAKGLSNQEAATDLRVSLETVKTHVGNVLTKLSANNRTQAVVMAYERVCWAPGQTTSSAGRRQYVHRAPDHRPAQRPGPASLPGLPTASALFAFARIAALTRAPDRNARSTDQRVVLGCAHHR